MRTIPITEISADEWHVAGIVVQAVPERADEIAAFVGSIADAEVHASGPTGKLVVTLEAPTSRAIAAHLESIQKTDGVLSAAMVYQRHESAADLDKEMTP
ncbi:chaperone NapD [Curvibacter sp. APW13]|uniref:chaperone NapD n=1 Tax=Curvibacter sp. APW13 TaxID=3077236 RepID=UPI0028DEE12E|nr:chaperone NapD [Curvibacter sp. APW13]MDT8990443.1 chaperone NapD [Curvibacter sp. APW13]